MKISRLNSMIVVTVLTFLLSTNIVAISNEKNLIDSKTEVDSVSEDLQKIVVLCSIEIENTGDTILRQIDWTFNAEAENGRIIFGDGINGRIPSMEPGQKETILLFPLPSLFPLADGQSPIGFGNIIMTSSVITSTGASAEDQERALLIGPFML